MSQAITAVRRRRTPIALLAALALVAAILGLAGQADAVHETGAFQLDGDASSSTATPAAAPDDWDRVCHQVTGTGCSTTNNTTTATAVSWVSEKDLNATIFTGGGSKDPIDIDQWAWKDGAGGLPDKDNLLHSFAARYSLPNTQTSATAGACPGGSTTATTCELLFFGSDRYDNSGDAQQGFWFFQNPITTDSVKSGGGFKFKGTHRNGDLLVISDFSNGGTTSIITVYKWNSAVSGNLELLLTSTDAKCDPALTASDAFCGIVNESTTPTASPWGFGDKSGNVNQFAQGEFYEGGINLSMLGLGNECFASVASETRSSTSVTATLKDFVLGRFGTCGATMTTTPSPGAAGTVAPSTIVYDTATVTGTGVANPPTPTGSVSFFLCGPTDTTSTTVCSTGGQSVGSTTLTVSNPSSTATAQSPNVDTTNLSPGRYCFRAEWPGDSNYTGGPFVHTGTGNSECFIVAKRQTDTVTTPIDSSGATTSTVALGATVRDRAVVTGDAVGGTPTGIVTFGYCGPIASGTCDGSDTTHTATFLSTATVSGAAGATTATATSSGFMPSAPGRYCFTATYGGNTVYLPSTDSRANECFTVTDLSSVTSAQTWLPNDTATVSTQGGSPVNGTLAFTLYSGGTCAGSILRSAETFTLSNATTAAQRTKTTTNGTNNTVTVSTTSTVSWKVEFVSTDSTSSSSHCESTALTITN